MADVPLIGEQFSNWQVYYTPSAFRTSLNVSEKLTWNNTRTQIRSPDSYNFGLNRTMNLDHKFSNNLSSKYSWAGQSKLNDYRGYAWLAVKNLDPGIVTNTTESLNTTYNPSVMKWLRPNFSYTANYRWSDDLSREGQNISTQLRFASNFTLTPVQFFEILYKPPTKKSTNKTRTRTSRSRHNTEKPNTEKNRY